MQHGHSRLKLVLFGVADICVVAAAVFALVIIQNNQSLRNTTQVSDPTPPTVAPSTPLDLTLVPQELIIPDRFATGALATPRTLNIPADFEISVYASGRNALRFFDFDERDNMYITDRSAGKIYLFQDTDLDGVVDAQLELDFGLRNPHGIDYFEGDLYVGEEHQIIVYRNVNADSASYSSKEVVVPNLPLGGHVTRTVVVGPDDKLYVSIGSSCNVCEEDDDRRAAIVRYNLDGSGEEIYATGLRNSVGIQFTPTGESGEMQLWSVNNGRDLIGDNVPPEEVNVISTTGNHYGWPYCYGNGNTNPEYPDEAAFCATETIFPRHNMQAHSAPLGLSFPPSMFGEETNFPSSLKDYLFIGFHGSWNRSIATGYKVVYVDTAQPASAENDFITGWLTNHATGEAWGRPVGVGFDSRGNMYISDDRAGAVYRVTYVGE